MPFSWTWLRSLFVGSSEDNDSHHHHAAVAAAVQANPQQATALASILKHLVFSGHIGAVQVGRLAQVCKDVNKEAMDEQVWANLCRRDYPSFSTAGEARSLYKRCSAPSASRCLPLEELPPLGPPRFTVNNIHLPLTIKYKGTVIISYNLCGPPFEDFVEHGTLRIKLNTPIICGRAQWSFSPAALLGYKRGNNLYSQANGLRAMCSNRLDPADFNVTLHVVRGTYENMACVFRSGDRQIIYDDFCRVHPIIDDGEVVDFDLSKEQMYSCINYWEPRSWQQEPPNWEQFHFGTSATAYAIVNRLSYPVHFGVTLNFGVVEGGDFALVDCTIEALQHRLLERFKGENGVTLLHILSSIEQT